MENPNEFNASVTWRRIFHPRIKCNLCLRDSFWGKKCCWDCKQLEKCIKKWKLILKKNVNIYCPYAKKDKWCRRTLDFWKEREKDRKRRRMNLRGKPS